jgi:hypothetical protein
MKSSLKSHDIVQKAKEKMAAKKAASQRILDELRAAKRTASRTGRSLSEILAKKTPSRISMDDAF